MATHAPDFPNEDRMALVGQCNSIHSMLSHTMVDVRRELHAAKLQCVSDEMWHSDNSSLTDALSSSASCKRQPPNK